MSPITRFAPYTVEVVRDCVIPADDAELSGDVYLPRGSPPAPAIVTLVPYLKDGLAGVTTWDAHQRFAAHGYPCVIVDFRGTGASGGRPRAPFDPAEGDDGAAVVAWAARQPWCDGAVGMWGVSYAALVALRTATVRPPALKAVISVMGFVDPERDFVHPGGRRGCLGSLGLWGLSTLAQHLTPPLREPADDRAWRRWRERLDDADPYLVDLLRHGPGAAVWRERAVDVSRIDVPTFCVTGWRDFSCEPTIGAFERIAAPKRLLVGPWGHTMPDDAQVAPTDFLSLAVKWWDRWLRDKPPEDDEHEVTVYVEGRDAWQRLEAWPPPAGAARWHAAASAHLVTSAPRVCGVSARLIDAAVGPRRIGIPTRASVAGRPEDPDNARALSFTSDPLDVALAICGRPVAWVDLRRPDRAGPMLAVELADVAPGDSSTLVAYGTAARTSPRSGAAGGPLGPQRVELSPIAYEFAAGHRLRLTVAASDFPRVWPDGAGDELAVASGPVGAYLDLPVQPAAPPVAARLPPADADRPSAALVLRADPLSTVRRDAASGAVTVTVGEHLVIRTTHDHRVVDSNAHASATVAAGATELTGGSTTHIKGHPSGDVTVRASVRVADRYAELTGAVTVKGAEVYRRTWTIRPGDAMP